MPSRHPPRLPRISSRRSLVVVAALVQTLLLAGAWTVAFRLVRGELARSVEEYIIEENAAFAEALAERLPSVDPSAEFGSPAWDELQRVIETAGHELAAGGFACLLDPEGRILCHPDIREDRSLRNVDLGSHIVEAAGGGADVRIEQVAAGETASGRVRFFADGVHYVATRRIEGTDLRLLVHQPEAALLGASTDLTGGVAVIGIAAIGSIVVIGGGALFGVVRSYDSTFEALSRRLQDSLQIARQIQLATLPRRPVTLAGHEIAGWSASADETGGDTYDAIPLRRGPSGAVEVDPDAPADEVLCVLADATGHGIGAALAVSEFRALVRMAARVDAPLDALVAHVNAQLAADLPGDRFVTAWFGRVRADAGIVESFSAGQAPILIRRAGGAVERHGADEPPLAALPELPGAVANRIALEPGDAIVVVSDGLHERARPDGARLGIDGLADVLAAAEAASAAAIVDTLRDAVADFAGPACADDDQTILVIRRT